MKKEQLIEQAVLRAFQEDQQKYEQADTSALSPDFRDRILQLADAPVEEKRALTIRQGIILLAAVLVMLICFTGMVAYPLISATISYHKIEDENGTQIVTRPTSSYEQDSIGVRYILQEIPDGYTEYYSKHDRWHSIWLWLKEGGSGKESISWMQWPPGAVAIINTEGCEEEKVVVQGYEGLWYHREDFSYLFWITDSCVCYLSVSGEDAEVFDIFDMAKGLTPIDVEWDRESGNWEKIAK